jgi:hypothetical protein
MLLKNFFLHPPGAGKTRRSGGRKQKQEARRTFILIKARPQLLDAVEICKNYPGVGFERPDKSGDERSSNYNCENQQAPACVLQSHSSAHPLGCKAHCYLLPYLNRQGAKIAKRIN